MKLNTLSNLMRQHEQELNLAFKTLSILLLVYIAVSVSQLKIDIQKNFRATVAIHTNLGLLTSNIEDIQIQVANNESEVNSCN